VIISVTLLASIGWLSKSDKFWFSWDIAGAVLVATGCIAEWILLYSENEHNDPHKRVEKAWAFVVAAGVTMDVFGLIHGIPEAIRMEAKVSQANERAGNAEKEAALSKVQAALAESNNLVTESNLLSLREAVQWRTISPQQETIISNRLAPIRKNGLQLSVSMAVSSSDEEARKYAIKLQSVLQDCGIETVVFSKMTAPTGFGLFFVENGTNALTAELIIMKVFKDANVQFTFDKSDWKKVNGAGISLVDRAQIQRIAAVPPEQQAFIFVGAKPLPPK
jgi:hypothetical protein